MLSGAREVRLDFENDCHIPGSNVYHVADSRILIAGPDELHCVILARAIDYNAAPSEVIWHRHGPVADPVPASDCMIILRIVVYKGARDVCSVRSPYRAGQGEIWHWC